MTNDRTFRVFVSSTFADMKPERSVLHEHVFPCLRRFCAERGARFRAIDLRWGVSAEAARDQQTMEICLDEVRRCTHDDTDLNFIALIGERYGWRPLPDRIPAADHRKLVKYVAAGERALLDDWYPVDRNSVPAERRLRPAGSPESWKRAEVKLRKLLPAATRKAGLKHQRYRCSATEQEIEAGVLSKSGAGAFCYLRTIDGMSKADARGRFLDETPGRGDSSSARLLEDLKGRLRRKLSPERVHEFAADWSSADGDMTRDHIDGFRRKVTADLQAAVLAALARVDSDDLDEEVTRHSRFAGVRASHFVGQRVPTTAIQRYLAAQSPRPMVVWGASGSGKTALMARCFLRCVTNREMVVIARFLGLTPSASNLSDLVRSICAQIRAAYGAEPASTVKRPGGELLDALRLATGERPLLLFLDALDQLDPDGDAHALRWLPTELPPNVRLVVSALERDDASGRCLRVLRERADDEDFVEVAPLSARQSDSLLSAWLGTARRTLRPEQRKHVLELAGRCPTPLYLRLAFEQARRWRSDDGLPMGPDGQQGLAPTVAGLIQSFLARLEEPEHHGEVLVARALGYLAGARDGLDEEELIEVLSRFDRSVLPDLMRRSPHSPHTTRLPFVVWSRLRADLGAYLTERGATGTSFFSFYHRQVREAAEVRYLGGRTRAARHRALMRFFRAQPDAHGAYPNQRKASELVFHALRGRAWPDLGSALTDPCFLRAKCAAGMVRDLIGECQAAVGQRELPRDVRRVVVRLAEFLQARADALDRWPDALPENAYNWERRHPVGLEAHAPLAERTWLRSVDRPARRPRDCVLTVEAHERGVRSVACSGSPASVLTGGDDGYVRVWDLATGESIREMERRHRGSVYRVAMTPDGRFAASTGSDHKLFFWDVSTGRLLRERRPHRSYIAALTASADGAEFITAGGSCFMFWVPATGERARATLGSQTVDDAACVPQVDATGRYGLAGLPSQLWHLGERRRGRRIVGKDGRAWSLAALGGGKHVLTAEETGYQFDDGQGTLRVWSPTRGKPLAEWQAHEKPVRAMATLGDGAQVLTASDDGTVKLWDVARRKCLRVLAGHDGPVKTIAVTPDQRYAVSGARDGLFKVWDLATSPRRKASEPPSPLSGCAMSADGSRLAVVEDERAFAVLSVSAGDEVRRWEPGPYRNIGAVTLDRSGERLFVKEQIEVQAWSVRTGRRGWMRSLDEMFGLTDALALSADDRWLAAGGLGEVALWDLARRARREWNVISRAKKPSEVLTLAFSPDGERLLVGGTRGKLVLCRRSDGETLRRLQGHHGAVAAATFSPDRRAAFSAGEDGVIRVWDVESAKCVRELRGHVDEIRCIALSPDGVYLASGGDDAAVLLWDWEAGKLLSVAYADSGVLGCMFRTRRRLLVIERSGRIYQLDVKSS